MTKLAWGSSGERFFETGLDRGVLYIEGVGYVWNGLTGVNEETDGGDPQPYYIDGYKYLNLASAEEYKATITAFSHPLEFAVCDGTLALQNGLFVTQQPRRQFDFAYRTKIGNDIQGDEHGYKIHIVYNALAAPSQKSNKTLGSETTPTELSWSITTTPPKMTGIRPTAHLVIDSRFTPPPLMAAIEDILYGTADADASMPPMVDILDMFDNPGLPVRVNMIQDPQFTSTENWAIYGGIYDVTGDVVDLTLPTSANSANQLVVPLNPDWLLEWEEGDPFTASYMVENTTPDAKIFRIAVFIGSGYIYGPDVIVGSDEDVRVSIEDVVTPQSATMMVPILVLGAEDTLAEGDRIRVRQPIAEIQQYALPYFDGDTAATDIDTYAWEGLPDASRSIDYSWY